MYKKGVSKTVQHQIHICDVYKMDVIVARVLKMVPRIKVEGIWHAKNPLKPQPCLNTDLRPEMDGGGEMVAALPV